jgi:hypothetical protein
LELCLKHWIEPNLVDSDDEEEAGQAAFTSGQAFREAELINEYEGLKELKRPPSSKKERNQPCH